LTRATISGSCGGTGFAAGAGAGACGVAAGAGADCAEAAAGAGVACGVAFAGAVREQAARAVMTKTVAARRKFTTPYALPEYVGWVPGSNRAAWEVGVSVRNQPPD
jgi:hypothetical protein